MRKGNQLINRFFINKISAYAISFEWILRPYYKMSDWTYSTWGRSTSGANQPVTLAIYRHPTKPNISHLLKFFFNRRLFSKWSLQLSLFLGSLLTKDRGNIHCVNVLVVLRFSVKYTSAAWWRKRKGGCRLFIHIYSVTNDINCVTTECHAIVWKFDVFFTSSKHWTCSLSIKGTRGDFRKPPMSH